MAFSGGNVGIGTTTPSEKLDVSGGKTILDYLKLRAMDGTTEGGELQLIGAGSNNPVHFDNFNGNARIFGFAAGKVLEVQGNIIATNPTAANHVTTKSYVDGLV